MLGFDQGGTAALDALFDTFDADGGGTIDYEELHALLRKELKASRPSSRGEARA